MLDINEIKEHHKRDMEWSYAHGWKPLSLHEFTAVIWCEEYGVIESHTQGNQLIYYRSYPYEHNTYKHIVNLDTLAENVTPLKKYYRPYKSKIGGKYYANLLM